MAAEAHEDGGGQPLALADHPYADFLGDVAKPGRYLGGEEQAIRKPWEGLVCRFVLAFPDLYDIGMSHLGTRILYDLINAQPDLCCERAFSPWSDLEARLRAHAVPLVSLENRRALRDFDVVGVSLQHELCYTNVLLNLDLGGIPLRSAARDDADPIVVAGGPSATHAEPLAAFVDAFLIGEAEEVLAEILRTIGRMRRAGESRRAILRALAGMRGIYVPSLYAVAVEPRTGLEVVVGAREAGVPERIERVFVRDLGEFKFPTRFPIPFAEAIFDRSSVEITRGCTEGCRFCQAGMIYRPVRERTPRDILAAVLEGTDAGGFKETSLTALSTADVSCIEPLIRALVPELARRNVSLGVASLRAYGVSDALLDDIRSVGIDGLTLAPEAGTQRMREVINKNVSDQDIRDTARRMIERGYARMKLYFIIGLPTETEEDVLGIVDTGLAILREAALAGGRRRRPEVTLSVSQHVPKPHTPFQWAAFDPLPVLDAKVRTLRELARRHRLNLKTHSIRESWLEAVFARGDRRLGEVLELAYRRGARFDGWREGFDYERWLAAFAEAGVDADLYTATLPVGVALPWSHLDMGFEDGFLEGEYRRALRGRSSPPCGKPVGMQVHPPSEAAARADSRRLVCYDCGIACDMSTMREQRVEALHSLAAAALPGAPLVAAAHDPVPDVPLARVTRSVLPDGSAYKANAEAAYSKVRIFFAKRGSLCFLSQLDLVRVLPRMFRRAGLKMGFSRGFKPQPRMSLGPALALGMGADAEAMEVDLILERSREDHGQTLDSVQRAAMAREVLASLRAAAPPGLELLDVRIVAPGEMRLGELVAGADYRVALSVDQALRAAAALPDLLASAKLPWVRERRVKKGKARRRGETERVELDLRSALVSAAVDLDASVLDFRMRQVPSELTARPREVCELLVGEALPDRRMTRTRLLARDERGEWIALHELGEAWRPANRRHPPPAA